MNKIQLNQAINTNYEKLVYINALRDEVYKIIFENSGIKPKDCYDEEDDLLLPIDELDNIKVQICMVFSYSQIVLRIYAKSIWINDEQVVYNDIILAFNLYCKKLDLEDFIIAFIKMDRSLGHYKFNNTIGKFEDIRLKPKDYSILFKSALSLNNIKRNIKSLNNITFKTNLLFINNINININKCSLCFELTEIKTRCNHTLCYRCWENITECNRYRKRCPICTDDLNEDDDERDTAIKIEYDGKIYLKSKKTGIIYDYQKYVNEKEFVKIGIWNQKTNKIDFQVSV
jgi:hypothetical protein